MSDLGFAGAVVEDDLLSMSGGRRTMARKTKLAAFMYNVCWRKDFSMAERQSGCRRR